MIGYFVVSYYHYSIIYSFMSIDRLHISDIDFRSNIFYMFLEELFPFNAGKWDRFYAKSIGNNICFVSFCINL